MAALGLPESDEGAAARRRSRRSRRSSVYARRSSAQSDAELEDASARFGLKVMQAILSALYDRTPVMQKAFRHLDESGTGFLAEHDFEQALEVVLAHERAEHDVLQREQVTRSSSRCGARGSLTPRGGSTIRPSSSRLWSSTRSTQCEGRPA